MIYILIGQSCAGKTSFLRNTWLDESARIINVDGFNIPVTETDDALFIGDYINVKRLNCGLDCVSRAQYSLLLPLVCELYKRGKDIVLDGEPIYSHPFFDGILEKGFDVKLYFIRCSLSTSIKRNVADEGKGRQHLEPKHFKVLKTLSTKSENLYGDYAKRMNGEVIDTDNIEDFTKFSMKTYKSMGNNSDKRLCVIIISHGRPNVPTEKCLRKSGYTGDIFVVVDDEDETLPDYQKNYGENVHVFHKWEWFDTGDNLDAPRSVGVFARNECLRVARKAGTKYYLELDDDMKDISYRYDSEGHLKGKKIRNLDKLFNAICDYMDEADVGCIGFGNAADYIGGIESANKIGRIFYNSFLLRTEDDIMWLGRHSDDSNTLITEQQKGRPWLKFKMVQANYDVWIPKNKSKKEGGSISTYDELGAYLLRYYLIMFHPDCTKITFTEENLDNTISERTAFPCIVSGRYKK